MPPLAHDRYFCFPTSGYISDAYITKGCLSNGSECKEIEGEKVINLLSSKLFWYITSECDKGFDEHSLL